MSCSWPTSSGSSPSVRAMLFADPHLLGIRKGHWFDKLRREWQMYRTYQTAMAYFDPSVVFILGDIFDEGQWATPKEFSSYVNRFHSMFSTPDSTKLYVLPGNHDLGFHYGLISNRIDLFKKAFDVELVQLVTVGNVHFVLANSMALANDGCTFCESALRKLKDINITLSCAKDKKHDCTHAGRLINYSRPILIQHFPLFRESDSLCNELDEAPAEEKFSIFRESWECLSENSTKLVLDLVQPRAAFSGHTHHGCLTFHTEAKIPEWTISSFSWRNKKNPAFLLARFSTETVDVSKCYMPRENTVLFIYTLFALFQLLWIFFACFSRCKRYRYLVTKSL